MARRYGRAPRGERVVAAIPHGHWKTTTFIAALRHDRITAPCVFDGPINGASFLAWVQQALVPTLSAGDIVIMDNLSSHKVAGVHEAIEAVGATPLYLPVPSIYSIVPPNDGSALRHGHHFEPVDFVIDHGRGRHDGYSAGSCQRTYARACGCRQRPRRHREELIESERGWSGREAFVTMMQTADLGQGNDRSGPGRLNGSSIRCVLAERQVGP